MDKEAVIKNILIKVLKILDEGIEQLQINDSLIDLGLNSITAIEMVVYLEEHYDIIIADEDLFIEKLSTIQDIIQIIERNGGR